VRAHPRTVMIPASAIGSATVANTESSTGRAYSVTGARPSDYVVLFLRGPGGSFAM
jgi:hypothetical protein